MTDRSPDSIIAVVDDDQRILEALKSLLESADHAVRLFSSSTALLTSGCVAEIDCLISDIDLPTMNGFELMQELRALRPALPIILITGHPDLLKRLPSTNPGDYRLFKKPFDGEQLLAAVNDALRYPRPRAPRM